MAWRGGRWLREYFVCGCVLATDLLMFGGEATPVALYTRTVLCTRKHLHNHVQGLPSLPTTPEVSRAEKVLSLPRT